MNKTIRALSTAALLAAPLAAWPVFDPVNDDTDIFLANPAFTAVRPNVLIFVDNTAAHDPVTMENLTTYYNGLNEEDEVLRRVLHHGVRRRAMRRRR